MVRSLADIHKYGPSFLPGLWLYGSIAPWRRRWLCMELDVARPSKRSQGDIDDQLDPALTVKELNERIRLLAGYLRVRD